MVCGGLCWNGGACVGAGEPVVVCVCPSLSVEEEGVLGGFELNSHVLLVFAVVVGVDGLLVCVLGVN